MLPSGETGFLGSLVVTRELSLVGTFRFDTEFDAALDLLAAGLAVDPIITHIFDLADARAAFDLAGNRAVASKGPSAAPGQPATARWIMSRPALADD